MEHGWALPLIIESIFHIKYAGVVPLGVSEKLSINEKVERYTKRRVTHYCSFTGPLGLSLNKRVLKENLHLCFYRFFLLRILHVITAILLKWPSKCILIIKIDHDYSYHRIHANAKITSTCIAIVEGLDFLCLRLPFVTKLATPEYITISESEIDLENGILADML